MKQFLKKLVTFILTLEAKLVLKKYKPKIIAVTGSVGKTSTKDAIYAILEDNFFSRKSSKSYNSKIGIPLVVLGEKSGWNSPTKWLKILINGILLVAKKQNYPRILILELGAEKPGDIFNIIKWVKPDIGVVTALGDIPVHVEFFASPASLRNEKLRILKKLEAQDAAVLNFDDETVLEMREKTKARIITYGLGEGADLRASNYRVVIRGNSKSGPLSGFDCGGITFKIDYKGSSVPVRISNSFGKQQMYACLAAAAVGTSLGINLIKISEALNVHYSSPPGRLKLIEGIKQTKILDDTYNSSPIAAHAALDTLKDIPALRKIAVLGDMMQLGKYTLEAHKEIGEIAAKICDVIFTVGLRSKFTAEGARNAGMPCGNVFEFLDGKEAGMALIKFLKKGDLILIKGSQAMRMEQIVENIMAHPENKEKLLVRQEKEWKLGS
jgi:UDP-N-acetylmuramoyl-tripeptide--D-alanyl-D-alanine ligase